MFGVYELEKLGLGGLKRNGRMTFHFRTTPFGFLIACEMALGVRNWFTDSLGFHTAYEIGLGVRNFSHALQKFCRVCKMSSQSWFIFAQCAKLVRMVCELSWFFLCQEFFLRTHLIALKSSYN